MLCAGYFIHWLEKPIQAKCLITYAINTDCNVWATKFIGRVNANGNWTREQ